MIIDLSIDTEKDEDCEYVKKIMGFIEDEDIKYNNLLNDLGRVRLHLTTMHSELENQCCRGVIEMAMGSLNEISKVELKVEE